MAGVDATHLIAVAGGESYALPLLDVREVMKDQALTPIPGVHPSVLGLMNIRGEIVAVVDLRRLLSLDDSRELQRLVVVSDDSRMVGLAVEDVPGVEGVEESEVQETPATTDKRLSEFVQGVAVLDGRVTAVLDVAKLIEAKQRELAGTKLDEAGMPQGAHRGES